MKRALLLIALLASACGKTGSGADTGNPTPTPTATATPDDRLEGIWRVSGSDEIGDYAGEAEVRDDGSFLRVIRYADDVTVEDGRALWTAWTGTATRTGDAVAIAVSLQKADFVTRRDALVRTPADAAPVLVTGAFTKTGNVISGGFAGEGITAAEDWADRRATGGAPIFSLDRTLVAGHEPPTETWKATTFGVFASFHALEWVTPYVADPRFQTAVHSFVHDRTDFAFYRANPDALRVVNKVVDPISQLETLSRANAYRFTLAEKAARFDAEITNELLDPVTHMVPAQLAGGVFAPSGDGALWTGTWVAAQAFKYEVTGDPQALANVAASIDPILRLQEITGDPTTFARTLRAATGNATGGWHAGTGPHAHLEWQEGGNNDMYKGLLYGYLTAYRVLCDGVTGYEATCTRIRANARTLADDIGVAQNGLNGLSSAWLAAYVTGEASYRIEAETSWAAQQGVIEQGNVMIYEQGIADWSGTHLNVVQFTAMKLLSEELPLLAGDTPGVVAAGVDVAFSEIGEQRMTMWNLAEAALGSGDEAALADALWRLREMPCPKTQAAVDHRIDVAEFVLSPYPSLPWKNDWTTNEGRAQSLVGVPLFEKFFDDYVWKDNPMGFRDNSTGTRKPGTDFSHAYWFGRRFGVVAPAE